jgi:ribosomal protein L7/L12
MPAPPPSGLSPEVELLAQDPSQKIAAIRLYREENPGVGLAEAKTKIEEFYKSGR